MTPSARRGPGESCRYRDMAPRRRRLAARGCLAARGRPWGDWPAAGKPSSQPVTHTTWSWRNIYPAGGMGQRVTDIATAAMAAGRHCRSIFYSHWLPQAQNSEPKSVAGRRRRRARWSETEMSEGAGSYDVSGHWRVLLCSPLQEQ